MLCDMLPQKIPENEDVLFRQVPKKCLSLLIKKNLFGPCVLRLFHSELTSWLHLCLHKSGRLNQKRRTSPSSGSRSNYTQNVFTKLLMKPDGATTCF